MKFSDNVFMVTGATEGIGKAAAMGLAKSDATVIIVGRNKIKADTVVREISKATGNDKVIAMIADFSSLDDVKKLADEFKSRFNRLDGLLNIAGLWIYERQETKQGHEMMFGVNHLSHFLLTNLLIEPLKNAQGQVITMTSGLHQRAKINWDDLQSEKSFDGRSAYCATKIMSILFTVELAERLKEHGIRANATSPGIVKSGLFRGRGGMPFILKLFGFLLLTPEQGADTSVKLALGQITPTSGGHFNAKGKQVPAAKHATDPSAAARLWKISADLVKDYLH